MYVLFVNFFFFFHYDNCRSLTHDKLFLTGCLQRYRFDLLRSYNGSYDNRNNTCLLLPVLRTVLLISRMTRVIREILGSIKGLCALPFISLSLPSVSLLMDPSWLRGHTRWVSSCGTLLVTLPGTPRPWRRNTVLSIIFFFWRPDFF